MRLSYAKASPFVRKVLVFAHEVGIADQITLAPVDVWAPDTTIFEDNPFGQVPYLTGPDGPMMGSFLICQYLDSLHAGAKLIPQNDWNIMRRHALADGVMGASIARILQHRRPAHLFSPDLAERSDRKMALGLDALEREAESLTQNADIATVTLGPLLGYLDFRELAGDWRQGREGLSGWYAEFAKRPAMLATAP